MPGASATVRASARVIAGLVAFVVAAGWLAGGARAQRDPGRPDDGRIGRPQLELEVDRCPSAPAVSADELRRAADESYRRGDVLYLQGDYRGASRAFITAYCLLPYYTVLKDIGQSFERLLEYERAIGYLERYVLAVPDDSKRIDACSVPPAVDKQNVSARIQVLATLPARISVATSPPGATVTLTSDAGVTASGVAGGAIIEARAGTYQMRVDLAGYQPETRPIEPQIGKPYSYYFELTPQQGALSVRAEPSNALIFVDDKLVGLGTYRDELSRGTYDVLVAAEGRLPERRRVEVRFGEETKVAVRLPKTESAGRTQLLVASVIGGATLAAYGAGGVANADGTIATLAGLVGATAAATGSYYGIPDDLSAGTSSLIITSSIVGGVEAALLTSVIAPDAGREGTAGLLGVVVGAASSAVLAPRLQLDAGDAALINSGALWGGIIGGLFAVTFDSNEQVGSGLALTGLNIGLASGALIGRSVDYSRRHVALIDLAGVGGLAAAAATQSLIDTDEDVADERRGHFALAGIAAGLLAGAYLTRNLDDSRAPTAGVRPGTSARAGASRGRDPLRPSASAGLDAAGHPVWTFGVAGGL
jgi:tetratricopeptide (TPR) repeat protein